MTKIIFATGNEGKIREIREMLKGLDVEVQSLKDAGIEVDIDENGSTFEENAIIKVKAIRPFTDALIIADDSGLEVDALNKEPGVYSARYLGEETPYSVKNEEIIRRLEGKEGQERSARFVCAIAALLPNNTLLTTRGTIEGIISKKPMGNGGFGYDPILYVPSLKKTTAQLNLEEKNRISHRGIAMRKMRDKLITML